MFEGISIAKLLKQQESDSKLDFKKYVQKELGSDLSDQLQNLAYEILWGSFHYQYIIGDPHPGNVIVMKDNKIGLIDFGIIAYGVKHPVAYFKFMQAYTHLDDNDKNLNNFLLASLQFFCRDLYLALDKISNLVPTGQAQTNFNEELSKIMLKVFLKEYSGHNLNDLVRSPKALVIFDRIANKNNRFGFNLKINDGEILRTLVHTIGAY